MVRQRRINDAKSCFSPDESAALKLAYDDAIAKLTTSRAGLGSSEALASKIIQLGTVRIGLGQTISGHADAQLLSFLARQALK